MTTTAEPPARKDQRPIVCGTDFSATAAEAVDVAAAIARRLGVTLLLVHVGEYHGIALSAPALLDGLITQSRRELAREVARVRGDGTTVEEKLLSGSVFEEMVNAATQSKARLIVVGAVGHGIARRLVIGSVAERVAETSPVPTLVVRPGSTLRSWIAGARTIKVLIGYDFSAASDAALRWVSGIRAVTPCEVTVAHVDWPPDEAQRLDYHGPMPLTENPEEIRTSLERNLRERIARIFPDDVAHSLLPGWGRTDAHLIQIANKGEFDLIVVGTHGRHGFSRLRHGSVSRGVLHHASSSVGVVPEPESAAAQ